MIPVYRYHPVTKEFTYGAYEGYPDPLNPSELILPPDSTTVKPPNLLRWQRAIWITDAEKWEVKQVDVDGIIEKIRPVRNEILQKTDFLMMPDYPLRHPDLWKRYRQRLRDLPDLIRISGTITWPECPNTQLRIVYEDDKNDKVRSKKKLLMDK
jgi:hypothetical protein